MGIDMTLSGHDPEDWSFRLCTNRGFEQLCDWIATLPPGAYPAVDAFGRDLRYAPTDALFLQLNDAALAHGPPRDGTDAMVRLVLERLGGGHPGESVSCESD